MKKAKTLKQILFFPAAACSDIINQYFFFQKSFQTDMSSSEKFCLKWNEFEKNISFALRDFKEEKDFYDVTLACEDKQVEAHKIIISACSPFFKNILKKHKHSYPLLFLKGVRYKDMLGLLDFMYHGEV